MGLLYIYLLTNKGITGDVRWHKMCYVGWWEGGRYGGGGSGLGIIFLHGHPLTQTLIRQPPNGEDRIRSPGNPYEICGS